MTFDTTKYEEMEGLNIRKPTVSMLVHNLYPAQDFIKDMFGHKAQLNSSEWCAMSYVENYLSRMISSIESRLPKEEVIFAQSRREEIHKMMCNYGLTLDQIQDMETFTN